MFAYFKNKLIAHQVKKVSAISPSSLLIYEPDLKTVASTLYRIKSELRDAVFEIVTRIAHAQLRLPLSSPLEVSNRSSLLDLLSNLERRLASSYLRVTRKTAFVSQKRVQLITYAAAQRKRLEKELERQIPPISFFNLQDFTNRIEFEYPKILASEPDASSSIRDKSRSVALLPHGKVSWPERPEDVSKQLSEWTAFAKEHYQKGGLYDRAILSFILNIVSVMPGASIKGYWISIAKLDKEGMLFNNLKELGGLLLYLKYNATEAYDERIIHLSLAKLNTIAIQACNAIYPIATIVAFMDQLPKHSYEL